MEIVGRFCKIPKTQSFFLFGPRGTGKTRFLEKQFPQALFIDLLLPQEFARFTARPESLIAMVEGNVRAGKFLNVVIDEVQKVPSLLSVVHSILEKPVGRNVRFILTGSSSRKLKAVGADLLAGRALTLEMHPFMAAELGSTWSLKKAMEIGMLPVVWGGEDPRSVLRAYLGTYLKEEVLQERLVRNLESFSRFLEAISFSQGSVLNVSAMARDAHVGQKTAEGYLELIEDLLIGKRLEVFRKKAKRELSAHSKFYFFDAGVFRAARPLGPLDEPGAIGGVALETLVYQHLRAWIAYRDPSLSLHYWRTRSDVEVDFVVYGQDTFMALEVKHSTRIRMEDLRGLRAFKEDYPEAKVMFLYLGSRQETHHGIACVPLEQFLLRLDPFMSLSS
ncbi:AAA family ATPase [Bdellovibrionota bacterium FG-2]